MKRPIILLIVSSLLTLTFYLYLAIGINFYPNPSAEKTDVETDTINKPHEQLYTIIGAVVIDKDIINLTDVIISLKAKGSNDSIKTNPDITGNFEFNSLDPKSRKLKVHLQGYEITPSSILIEVYPNKSYDTLFNLIEKKGNSDHTQPRDMLYTVHRKDKTLGEIADKFDTTYISIVDLNGIEDPDKIKKGQQFRIIPGEDYWETIDIGMNINNVNANLNISIQVVAHNETRNSTADNNSSQNNNTEETKVLMHLSIILLIISSIFFGWQLHVFFIQVKSNKRFEKILLSVGIIQSHQNESENSSVVGSETSVKTNEPLQPAHHGVGEGTKQVSSSSEPEIIKSNEAEIALEKEKIISENKLLKNEISKVKPLKPNNWLTVGASVIGKSHTEANPSIPCQDNHYYGELQYGWNLAIVCDGAGSAKMSHKGSELIAKQILPTILNKNLPSNKWYKKGRFPSDSEWKRFAVDSFRQTHTAMQITVNKHNEKQGEQISLSDLASTVILVIYRSEGVVTANIGDGRAGYLNGNGDLKSFFSPFKGEEANETIFITSKIWNDTEAYISTNVIQDDIWAITAMSDGFEKSSYICSKFIKNNWFDLNLPSKKLFLPLITQLKDAGLKNVPEEKIKKKWEILLTNGNKVIENEPDDRTMILSVKL